MGSLDVLKQEVDRLYTEENPARAEFAGWLYRNHVYQVAEAARAVAERFGGNPDVAYAAGLLHDVADAVMPRQDPSHAERSAQIARELLAKAGFSAEEIATAVDDALRYHACHGDERPQTPEGKALSTGDAIAHITTDFYPTLYELRKERGAAWIIEKFTRDFTTKIAYDEIRDDVRRSYETLTKSFVL